MDCKIQVSVKRDVNSSKMNSNVSYKVNTQHSKRVENKMATRSVLDVNQVRRGAAGVWPP